MHLVLNPSTRKVVGYVSEAESATTPATSLVYLRNGHGLQLFKPSRTAGVFQDTLISGGTPRVSATGWTTPLNSFALLGQEVTLEGEDLQYHVRRVRDRLLAETDWTQTVDAPLTAEKKTAYATYRQALRDYPATAGLTMTTPWPVKP